jgi:2-dehydro-3-deoxy-D-gluconate 5-dehydrogenase
MDLFDLTGRTALVTGARTGIGRAIALGLAGAGADVVLLGHRSGLEEVESGVRGLGRRAFTVIADLSDLSEAASMCDGVLDRHRIDILVNAAGVIRRFPAEEHPLPDWRAVLTVNLDALFLLCQRFGRPMLERGAGKIVNIASLLSFQGGITVAAYSASKHGVAGVTKALANEWASRNVQVNAIAPGYIETNVTEGLRADAAREASIRSRIPAGRWGRPDDLVGAAVFLSSPASDYVNGHLLVVDGGWMSR